MGQWNLDSFAFSLEQYSTHLHRSCQSWMRLYYIYGEGKTFTLARDERGKTLHGKYTLYSQKHDPIRPLSKPYWKKIPSFVSRKGFYLHGLFWLAWSFSYFGKQILLGHGWYIAQDRMISTCHLKWGKYSWPSDMQTISSSSYQHLFLLALNWCKKQCHPATSILEIDQL